MKSMRIGVFETNSSSTHSITLCSKVDYDKWEYGEILLNKGWQAKEKFISRDEAIQKLKVNEDYKNLDFNDEDEVNDALKDMDYYTSENYFDDDLESFESTFTTKNGEVIVAFGKYGYDG